MITKQKLELMIREFLLKRWPRNAAPTPNCFLLAETILDAGYVRLEDVEIDVRKLYQGLQEIQHKKEFVMIIDIFDLEKLAEAISQAKGIIKVKEGIK